MTEFYNVNVNTDKANKNKPKQGTQTQAKDNTKDINLFDGYTPGKGPLRPKENNIPSIFDGNFGFKPQFPNPWKKKTPDVPIPFITEEMRREYNEKTIVGLFRGLTSKNSSKANNENIVKLVHCISPDNYKLAFRSFEGAGMPLSTLINETPHLTNAQKKKCLEHLVECGKKTADYGQQRSDDVVPNMKKLIAKYDNNAGLDAINVKRLEADFKKIINRSDTLKTEIPARPNGKIDLNFKQGNTGDCWLLAGIQSLSMTPEGKKILDNAVKVDANGNATVTLKGVGKKYTVTARDLKCSNELSTGDTDVRALEIAMDRYFRETVPEGSADIDGNTVGQALKLLGDPNKTQELAGTRGVYAGVNYLLQTKMKNKAAVTGMSGNVNPNDIVAHNEKGERVKIYNAHAYSIKSVSADSITLINPHDTSHTITMSMKQYLSHFNLIGVTDTSGLK